MLHLFTCHGRIMPRLAELLLSNLIDRNPRRQVFLRRSPNSKTGSYNFQEYIIYHLKIIGCSCSVELLLSMTFTF